LQAQIMIEQKRKQLAEKTKNLRAKKSKLVDNKKTKNTAIDNKSEELSKKVSSIDIKNNEEDNTQKNIEDISANKVEVNNNKEQVLNKENTGTKENELIDNRVNIKDVDSKIEVVNEENDVNVMNVPDNNKEEAIYLTEVKDLYDTEEQPTLVQDYRNKAEELNTKVLTETLPQIEKLSEREESEEQPVSTKNSEDDLTTTNKQSNKRIILIDAASPIPTQPKDSPQPNQSIPSNIKEVSNTETQINVCPINIKSTGKDKVIPEVEEERSVKVIC